MPRKNILILGGSGFAGTHMAQHLAADHRVFSYGREVDVRDREAVRAAIHRSKPDWVANFASITTVRESFADPSSTHDIAFTGTLNILSALKESGFVGKVLNISSSEVYGYPMHEELPLTESSPVRPMSPYSVSRLAVEFLCYQWWRTEGIRVVTARPFTHIGPGQSARFSISSFARQIAEISLGMREPVLRVGELSTTRDFTDVRDTVRAYRLLLEFGAPGEVYNVCSGVETSLSGALMALIDTTGKTIRVETDPAMLRSAEQNRLRGSYDKLRKATQWCPRFTQEQTLRDMFDFWVKELGHTALNINVDVESANNR